LTPPTKLNHDQRRQALQRLANGETLVDVARIFAVDPTGILMVFALAMLLLPLCIPTSRITQPTGELFHATLSKKTKCLGAFDSNQ
jgi:hypothetical protein